MKQYRRLTLLVVFVYIAVTSGGTVQSVTPSLANSSDIQTALPESLWGISGTTSQWWTVVQNNYLQPDDDHTVQTAQISGLPSIPNWGAESNKEHAQFGHTVGTAGDVNGDGYDDIVIGAPFFTDSEEAEGLVAVYYGSAAGLSLIPDWFDLGEQAGASFGYSVGTAGDVNGDGYDDIIAGAPFFDHDEFISDRGIVAVYHGSAAGLSVNPDWIVEGGLYDTQFGHSVSTAGDVNNDGYDDIIIGSPFYNHGEPQEGAAAVYLGSASGLSLTPSWHAESDRAATEFGYSVATAGDVNGDGYDDVIVGAPCYGNPQPYEGAVAVYHGSASGLSLVPNWGDESDTEDTRFGHSVGTAGDVNGDGYDDIIVGAPYYTHGQNREGGIAIYYGSASGLSINPNWGDEGDWENAQLGNFVGTSGDVNSDGFDDIIVGAPLYGHGEPSEGAAVVYYGSAQGPTINPVWMDEGDQVAAEFGRSVGTAGDVNGDGVSDVIAGAPRYDHGQEDEGIAVVYYGSGYFHIYLPITQHNP